MSIVRIGIVDDDLITGQSIANMATELGYTVIGTVVSYMEALEMIESEKPDILLLDINLSSKKDGIDLAWKIRTDYKLPFVLMTDNADAATIARAKETRPFACLIKPFKKDELYVAIELCLYNFSQIQQTIQTQPPENQSLQTNYIIKNALFIKQGQLFRKILLSDILYLESENVYVYIHTMQGKMLVRSTLSHYLDLLVPGPFFRVHRSFAVNTEHIQTISSEYITVGDSQLPVSKIYREELLERLRLG